jgi:hypothetical protein
MGPQEVIDVDGCSLVIEEPDAEFAQQIDGGAVVQIGASCWLGNRAQLDTLIATLVMYANELDRQQEQAA